VAESTKAASDVYAPIGGRVAKVNLELKDKPNLLNSSPYGEGWIAQLADFNKEDLNNLMTHQEYKEHVAQH
jgi:glycine cleavage system H protein